MSRRPAWALSLVAFAAGLLAILASADLPTAVGQQKALVVPPTPQAPTLTTPANLGAKPGASAELVLTGTNLADPVAVLLSCPGKATIIEEKKPDAARVKVKVELPEDAPTGLYTIRVATKEGVSNLRPFVVDELPSVAESDGNRSKDTAQPVATPCVVTGRTDAEASDFFKVKVGAGQKLTFEVLARRIGSPLDPIIVLHDAKTKRELIDLYADDTAGLQSDCRLTHTFKDSGEILVEVRDTTYRGGGDYFYRLRIGEFPGATTAFPLVIERGKSAKIGFAGPESADLAPVAIDAPKDPALAAVYAAPKRSSGIAGWPVPVLLADVPQVAEKEPNNDPAKATRLPVPGGVSAKFAEKNDLDHFAIKAKKGQKLAIEAMTYEVNAPTEVLIKVLDAKGKELAKSNPAQVPPKVDFTPPDDGDYTIACEHLNYLHGPNEVYHLSVAAATPDFAVALALDRYDAAAGNGTAVAVTSIARLNGYGGPVDLEVVGSKALSGKITVPAGQTQTYVPLLVKSGTKPGAYSFRVKASAKIDGKEIVRYATLLDVVKGSLGGMPNPPAEMLNECVVGVVEQPAFALTLKAEEKTFTKGKAGKVLVEAERERGADGDIAIAPLFTPPNVAVAAKPVPKGKTEAEITVTPAANAAAGQTPVVLRATTKVGGKDYAVIPAPVVIEVIDAKKGETKKEEPKKKKGKKK